MSNRIWLPFKHCLRRSLNGGIGFALLLTLATCAGGGSQTSALEQRGLQLVWRDSFSTKAGEAPSAQVLFGDKGLYSEWIRARSQAPGEHRSIAPAPDGRMALQFTIPEGRVPHGQFASLHWPDGVTHAGLAVDVWVPGDFEYPTQCLPSSWSRYPGTGRWPIGLWIGGSARGALAGGVPIPGQKGISVRLNRGSGGDPAGQGASFSAYVYHLNRWLPKCTKDGAPCSASCKFPSEPAERCYGGGLKTKSGVTPRDRWVTVELEVKMDEPGRNNGCVAFWVDGSMVDQNCNFDFGKDRGWLIRGYYAYHMWHCDGSSRTQQWWMSNIRMYGPG
ncbi:MAG: hypothetical protein V2I43_05200 [Parvularcula sp.]|nr:hypothetical protein [Parvularcula sp.]